MMRLTDLKVALRVHKRQKLYSLITVLGLASGITLSVFLFQYVAHELSYDRHHSKSNRIWRVAMDLESGSGVTATARSGHVMLDKLKEYYPQIEDGVRIRFGADVLLSSGDRSYRIDRYAVADTSIFNVFDIPLVEGDPASALRDSNSVVISREAAVALFGQEDPIGKAIRVNNAEDMMVTGILGEMNEPAHFQFQALGSLVDWVTPGHPVNAWYLLAFHTYFVLPEGTSIEPIQAGIQSMLDTEAEEAQKMTGNIIHVHFEKLTDIHLHSHYLAEIQPNGDLYRVIVFGTIALLVILIACINFINLATARSTKRAAEVGLRKVVGARRDQLVRQFFGESALLAAIAFILAYVAIELLMPIFNNLFGLELQPWLILDPSFLLVYLGLYLVVTILSGLGPALVFSSFRPADVIKGQVQQGPIGRRIRQGLVVIQFAVSVVLIIGTIVVYRQMDYLNKQDLGFIKDNILVLRVQNSEVRSNLETIKERLVEHSAIYSASGSATVPGAMHAVLMILPEGVPDDDIRRCGVIAADYDYAETFGIEMVDGRYFDREIASDSSAFVLNELLVEELGWEDPVGKEFDWPPRGDGNEGRVIGVYKSYRHQSLHEPMQASLIHLQANPYSYLSVRFDGAQLEAVKEHVQTIWEEFAPGWPFEYFFIDDNYEEQYAADRAFGQLFLAFSSFTIFIACLGLFGLAAYVAQARTKEIGLRKVLGASVGSIVMLLSKEFLVLVLIANAIAWPVAWYVMKRWLGSFEMAVGVEPLVLLGAGLVTLLIAFLTVSGQAVKAALTRPANTLRVE